MRLRSILVLAALALVFLSPMRSGEVLAHHSRAAYGSEDRTLQGTVVEYRWRNPHVMVFWEINDDSGQVVRWQGEMAAITSQLRDGMTKDSLQPGDEITITVRPNKAGTPESVIREIVKTDGTVVYSASEATLRR